MEGTDTEFMNRGNAVAQAQPEDADVRIGRPMAFHPDATAPLPPDRWHPGQPDSSQLGIERPIAFQSPEIHMGERRWYVVGYSG